MSSAITNAVPGAGLARRLVGRARECCLLDGLVESAEGDGAAVVIAGEAGVAKTALLTYAADVASHRSQRVIRAWGGIRSCPGVRHSRRPAAAFAKLPKARCQALEVCLALASGLTTGPLAVGAEVLASAAAEQPLAVLVDDFPWVNPEPRLVLLFAPRRLAAERIGMLLATRDEPSARPHERGRPALQMGGRSSAECAELAWGLGADRSGSALRSLVEVTDSLAVTVAITSAWSATHVIGVPGEESETVPASTGDAQIALRYIPCARFYLQCRRAHDTRIARLRSRYRKDIGPAQIPAGGGGGPNRAAFGYEKTLTMSQDLCLALETVPVSLPYRRPSFFIE